MYSTELISKANKFLDEIALPKDEKDLAKKLGKNIKILSDFRDEMLFYGFGTPFLALLAKTRMEFEEEVSQAEIKDLMKQLQKIRDLANSKKFSLSRVRVALQAHKLALARVREQSGKELVRYLPTDGNYLKKLSELEEYGLFAYKHISDFLSSKSAESEKAIQVTIRYPRDGKLATEKIKLLSEANMESRLKRVYGQDVEILGTRIYTLQLPLLKRSVRICLATAYASLAATYAKEHIGKKINGFDRDLREYYKTMQKYGLRKDARIDMYEEFEDVKEELFKKGLMVLSNNEYILSPEIEEPLLEKKRLLKLASLKKAETVFGQELFEYFLLKPKRERESSLLFSSLNATPDISQLAFLDDIIEQEYKTERLSELLRKKFELETVKLNIKGKELGVALFYLLSNRDIKYCSSKFNCPKSEIEKAAKKIALMVESRSEKLKALGLIGTKAKARKFLELVKNVDNKGRKK